MTVEGGNVPKFMFQYIYETEGVKDQPLMRVRL